MPRPATGTQWELRFCKKHAVAQWDQLCSQLPEVAARVYDSLRDDPRAHSDRCHRLRGAEGSGTHRGEIMDRWQFEVTGGGRLFYLIDDPEHTVWLEDVALGHPKRTERG